MYPFQKQEQKNEDQDDDQVIYVEPPRRPDTPVPLGDEHKYDWSDSEEENPEFCMIRERAPYLATLLYKEVSSEEIARSVVLDIVKTADTLGKFPCINEIIDSLNKGKQASQLARFMRMHSVYIDPESIWRGYLYTLQRYFHDIEQSKVGPAWQQYAAMEERWSCYNQTEYIEERSKTSRKLELRQFRDLITQLEYIEVGSENFNEIISELKKLLCKNTDLAQFLAKHIVTLHLVAKEMHDIELRSLESGYRVQWESREIQFRPRYNSIAFEDVAVCMDVKSETIGIYNVVSRQFYRRMKASDISEQYKNDVMPVFSSDEVKASVAKEWVKHYFVCGALEHTVRRVESESVWQVVDEKLNVCYEVDGHSIFSSFNAHAELSVIQQSLIIQYALSTKHHSYVIFQVIDGELQLSYCYGERVLAINGEFPDLHFLCHEAQRIFKDKTAEPIEILQELLTIKRRLEECYSYIVKEIYLDAVLIQNVEGHQEEYVCQLYDLRSKQSLWQWYSKNMEPWLKNFEETAPHKQTVEAIQLKTVIREIISLLVRINMQALQLEYDSNESKILLKRFDTGEVVLKLDRKHPTFGRCVDDYTKLASLPLRNAKQMRQLYKIQLFIINHVQGCTLRITEGPEVANNSDVLCYDADDLAWTNPRPYRYVSDAKHLGCFVTFSCDASSQELLMPEQIFHSYRTAKEARYYILTAILRSRDELQKEIKVIQNRLKMQAFVMKYDTESRRAILSENIDSKLVMVCDNTHDEYGELVETYQQLQSIAHKSLRQTRDMYRAQLAIVAEVQGGLIKVRYFKKKKGAYILWFGKDDVDCRKPLGRYLYAYEKGSHTKLTLTPPTHQRLDGVIKSGILPQWIGYKLTELIRALEQKKQSVQELQERIEMQAVKLVLEGDTLHVYKRDRQQSKLVEYKESVPPRGKFAKLPCDERRLTSVTIDDPERGSLVHNLLFLQARAKRDPNARVAYNQLHLHTIGQIQGGLLCIESLPPAIDLSQIKTQAVTTGPLRHHITWMTLDHSETYTFVCDSKHEGDMCFESKEVGEHKQEQQYSEFRSNQPLAREKFAIVKWIFQQKQRAMAEVKAMTHEAYEPSSQALVTQAAGLPQLPVPKKLISRSVHNRAQAGANIQLCLLVITEQYFISALKQPGMLSQTPQASFSKMCSMLQVPMQRYEINSSMFFSMLNLVYKLIASDKHTVVLKHLQRAPNDNYMRLFSAHFRKVCRGDGENTQADVMQARQRPAQSPGIGLD